MNKTHTPSEIDDFNHIIEGIGPGIERRLHNAGINSYTQLGGLSPEKIYPLVKDIPGINIEKITKLDWPGQARKLALDSVTDESLTQEVPSGNRQYDASFTVKLLLNEDHSVRAMRMVDNRSKAEEQWATWDENRLIDFMVQRADLSLEEEQPTKLGEIYEESETTTVVNDKLAVPTEARPAQTALEPSPSVSLSGKLQMPSLEIVPIDTNRPGRLLRHGMPFGVYLNLDLTEVKADNNNPLECMATIYAKNLSHHGQNELVGESKSSISPGSSRTVRVPVRPLKRGSYRVDAVVTVNIPSSDTMTTKSISRVFLDGGIVKVY